MDDLITLKKLKKKKNIKFYCTFLASSLVKGFTKTIIITKQRVKNINVYNKECYILI